MSNQNSIQPLSSPKKSNRCVACGKSGMEGRRRYCSKECRKQILWVLSLSKGLLRIFNARYASFSFNKDYVILDILPAWSKDISRFIQKRSSKKKPAVDLKDLILRSGSDWYEIIDNKNSKSYASLFLLKKNSAGKIPMDAIRPNSRLRPKFSRHERESLKLLQIEFEELMSERCLSKIRSAYKKMAKVHHPDKGGDAEKFKRLNEAHEQMLLWARNPQFTSRKALVDCWSYDASTNRWAAPL